MPLKKRKAARVPVPIAEPVAVEPVAVDYGSIATLSSRIEELEGDLYRIVDLLVKGDLESAKFKEILSKRQGKA